MRVFIAVDIDDQKIISHIVSIGREIKASGAHVKLVEPENIHITLKFLGEIQEKDLEIVNSIVSESVEGIKKFYINMVGVGAFPTPKNPRVIWVGVSEGAQELTNLAVKVSSQLERLGFRKENRPFSPHVTICRVKRYNPRLKELIKRYEDQEFGKFLVKEVRVKQSKLTPQGPIYKTLFRKELL